MEGFELFSGTLAVVTAATVSLAAFIRWAVQLFLRYRKGYVEIEFQRGDGETDSGMTDSAVTSIPHSDRPHRRVSYQTSSRTRGRSLVREIFTEPTKASVIYEPRVGDARFDAVVTLPDGTRVFVDAKTPSRQREIADMLLREFGADGESSADER